MKMVKNIILIGVGGQGTILTSKILATGLVEMGYDVKMSEIHGMSQRGGSVSTQIRYGEKYIPPTSARARRISWWPLKSSRRRAGWPI